MLVDPVGSELVGLGSPSSLLAGRSSRPLVSTWALIICWIQTSCSGVKAGGAWVPAVADRPPRVGPVVPLFPAVAAPRPPLRGRPRAAAVVAGPFAVRLGVARLRVGGIDGRLNDGSIGETTRTIELS